ncbi:hypothetical protein [Rhizobium leguminosarum]|uniref:hypothetical protein n=1 Tax=Rhizobium leguminosarum TaxID=384 RepID=UPI001C9561D6|nr:hypothetical protein [Rhizobium leguminosarum]MBY5827904.1 hypothetical protein [Rhizobium leguminosarum]
MADTTDRINALPPEMLQHIMGFTLQGSLDEQLRTISNMARTNANFRSQLTSEGPLRTRHQQLLGLAEIRTQLPRSQGELPGSYARRLGRANVTPEGATLLAFGEANPQVTDRLRGYLEFQPAEVQARIATLRTQHPGRQWEPDDVYARRLGRANVPLEDAALAAFGEANPQVTDRLRGYLEFQPAEVQARITTLRTQYPIGQGELAHSYALRLGRANVPLEDAALATYGDVHPQVTDRLRGYLEFQPAEVQARIETLRTRHPRKQGERDVPYALRLGRANVPLEDAAFVVFGSVEPRRADYLREYLEFQPAEVQARITTLRTQYPIGQEELPNSYARRLRRANVTPEDAALLAFDRAIALVESRGLEQRDRGVRGR